MKAKVIANQFVNNKFNGDLVALLSWVTSDDFQKIIDQINEDKEGIPASEIRKLKQEEADSLLRIMDMISGLFLLLEQRPEAEVIYPPKYWKALQKIEASIRAWSYVLSKIASGKPFNMDYVIMRQLHSNISIAINFKKAYGSSR